jgi:hypothetical protein
MEPATRKYCNVKVPFRCCHRGKYGEFQSVSVTEAGILKEEEEEEEEEEED